jgi:hypothetical protein
VLVGAGLGQVYARWGAGHLWRYTNVVLLVPGAVAVALALVASELPVAPFGTGAWSFVPTQVFLRTGACLIVLALIAHLSQRMKGLPRAFGAVAQETLLIYFVHLCIVYGSIWNDGLAQIFGPTLGPGSTLLAVVLLLAAMTALAWSWNRFKHTRPRLARWTAVAVGALLVYQLL